MKNTLAAAGVCCIFGGETFCIFGPLQYQDIIHIVCHVILYLGIGFVAGGAALHGRDILRKRKVSVTPDC